MKKIDLVMWTLNSEKYLAQTLNSIKKEIPTKFINRKIMVDGGSLDNTINIAKFFEWEFHKCKKGIPYQANMALEMVDTPIFASFEHDIVLCPDWYMKIINTITPQDVAVSQGIRISMNKTLRAIEKYSMLRDYVHYTSIDNNLYKTKIIRNLGGFNLNCPVSCDRDLQDKVRANGFKWLINNDIISNHLVFNFIKYAHKCHERRLLNDYQYDIANIMFLGKRKLKSNSLVYFSDFVIKCFLSFPMGFIIARKFKEPSACWGYPFWRFYKLKTLLELIITI